MSHFPNDASLADVIRALRMLGFAVVREGNHIAMVRENRDGSRTPLTVPNRRKIKGSTPRQILRQSHIERDDFLSAFYDG